MRNPEGRERCAACGYSLAAGPRDSQPPPGPGDETLAPVAPLAGRLEESRRLAAALERSFAHRQVTVAVVSGAGGIGKTRLVDEVRGRMSMRPGGVRILDAAVRTSGDGPFAPFSRVLLQRFDVTPSSSPTSVRSLMASEVSRVLGAQNAPLVAETTHLVGHVAGVPFPDSPILRSLEDDQARLRTRVANAVRLFFERDAASGGALLVILDRFHLAQDAAVDLVAEIAAKARAVPLALVLVGRPPLGERADRFAPEAPRLDLRLSPLSVEEAAEFLRGLMPQAGPIPDELAHAAWMRAEGVPSALREMARLFVESEVVDTRTTPWTFDLGRLADANLPVTLEDALRSRIARLAPDERAALERASVIGDAFWSEAVLALERGDADAAPAPWSDDSDMIDLGATLRRLVSKGFLAPVEHAEFPGTIEWAFRHAGMRQILYDSVSDETRERQHRLAAQWLEIAAAARRGDYAVSIGEHYERGRDLTRSAFQYLYAAGLARAAFQNERAVELFQRGLACLSSDDRTTRVDALHDLGSVQFLVGDLAGAEGSFTAMLRDAWVLGHRGKGGAAWNRIGRIHRGNGDFPSARACFERGLALFRTANDVPGVASSLDDLGRLAWLEGDYEKALRVCAESLEIRRSLGDRRGTALSLHNIGNIQLARGLFRQAEACYEEALAIRQSLSDATGSAETLNSLGVVQYERGEATGAQVRWEQALDVAEQTGDRRMQAMLLNNLGEVCCTLDQETRAVGLLSNAAILAEELGDRRLQSEVHRNLGVVHLRRNDLSLAREHLELALSIAEDYGSREAIGLALRNLGELFALTLGDEEGAQPGRKPADLFAQSVAILEELGNEKEVAKSLSAFGYYLLEQGETENGKAHLEKAAAIFSKIESKAGERIKRTIGALG
jgi:tetratricopeptide (TPR) repeat protein